MIAKRIPKLINEAMKAGDQVRLSTLKLLSASLHNARIDKGEDLSESEELKIVQSEAKKRKDAIEAYEKAAAKEKQQREEAELAVLQEFLPEELSDEELEKIVTEVIDEVGGEADFGRVMGLAMQKTAGRADGKKVSEIVRSKIK